MDKRAISHSPELGNGGASSFISLVKQSYVNSSSSLSLGGPHKWADTSSAISKTLHGLNAAGGGISVFTTTALPQATVDFYSVYYTVRSHFNFLFTMAACKEG